METDIYKDIAERTNGDIYLGIVGPVRTGKSTFIKKFMELRVLPGIENTYMKERAKDELPQSAGGKTIMTTEPKFVPNEAVEICTDDGTKFRVRLIDCVGYLVDGAEGHMEQNNPRMVSTPWSDEKIPFALAAETGTQKVIRDHSTIGVVVLTDGSITGIDRINYEKAEEKVIKELKEINKPFVIVLNSIQPDGEEAKKIAAELSEKYDSPVCTVSCAELKTEDIDDIMKKALYEFPVSEVQITFPTWIETLETEHPLKSGLIESVKNLADKVSVINDINENIVLLSENENIKNAYINTVDAGTGTAVIEVSLVDDLFFDILSETTGMDIEDEYSLISIMQELSVAKSKYDKISYALDEVNRNGYGIVTPSVDEIKLEKPELIKQGGRYGIRINAEAPGIHMIKADVRASVSPVVGSEQQSEELVKTLTAMYNTDVNGVLDYGIFGRSIGELITDDLNGKILRMPEDTRMKFKDTVEKIVNEGNGGMICILL